LRALATDGQARGNRLSFNPARLRVWRGFLRLGPSYGPSTFADEQSRRRTNPQSQAPSQPAEAMGLNALSNVHRRRIRHGRRENEARKATVGSAAHLPHDYMTDTAGSLRPAAGASVLRGS
jgi:hypothetical protein